MSKQFTEQNEEPGSAACFAEFHEKWEKHSSVQQL